MDWYIVIFTLAFILFDYLTGLAQAIYNKQLDSSIMRRGLFHKAALICVIGLAVLVEYALPHIDLGSGLVTLDGWLLMAVCGWVCLMELTSILENLAKINNDLANSKLLEFFAVATKTQTSNASNASDASEPTGKHAKKEGEQNVTRD